MKPQEASILTGHLHKAWFLVEFFVRQCPRIAYVNTPNGHTKQKCI